MAVRLPLVGGAVVTDPVALAALLRSPNGPVFRRIVEDAAAVRLVARRHVGVSKLDPVPRRNFHRPGTLRDNIVYRVVNTPTGIVGSVGVYNVRYARLHHDGTPPHEIKARAGGPPLVFHWPRAGGVVAFRKVQHPGTRPNPYLTDALEVLTVRYA